MNNSKKENVENNWFCVIIIVQTVVAALLIMLLLFSAYSDGKFASMMRSEYVKLMSGDISVSKVISTLNKIKSVVTEFSEDELHSDKNESETEIEIIENAYSETESASVVVGGGDDLQFTSLNTLEGICFDEYDAAFTFITPLEDYKITSRFGYRISPITQKPGLHTGIDLAAEYGTQIYASADGIVTDAGYDNSYGYYVKLKHSDNFESVYAHCSSLCVEAGDICVQGDLIAKVGSTGSSTGNHLHFEIRKDGIRLNPEFVLKDL